MLTNTNNSNNIEDLQILKIKQKAIKSINLFLNKGITDTLYDSLLIIYNIKSKYYEKYLLTELLNDPDSVGGIDSAIKIALYLIDNHIIPKGNIDINGVTEYGKNTILHSIALYPYSNEVNKLLLAIQKVGIDPMIPNSEGKTAYEIAFKNGNLDTLSIFEAIFYTDNEIKSIKQKLLNSGNNIYKNLLIKNKYIEEEKLYNVINTRRDYTNKQLNYMRKHINIKPLDLKLSEIDIPKSTPLINTIDNFIMHNITTYGHTKNYNMKVITIPEGSLLFNSTRIKDDIDKLLEETDTSKIAFNITNILKGILPFNTNITIKDTFIEIESCLDHLSQKFFYTNPVGGSALSNLFNITYAFQTKRNINLALLMSPGDYHRKKGEHPDKILCSDFPTKQCACSIEEVEFNNGSKMNKCKFGYEYDVCLRSEFLQEHNLDGHIAIPKKDSYEKLMYKFDKLFMQQQFSKTYTDTHRIFFDYCRSVDDRQTEDIITGFPEIVLHTFGTDWYNDVDKKTIKIIKELPSDNNIIKWITNLLVELNTSLIDSIGLGIESSIKLISLATPKYYINLEKNRIKYAFNKLEIDALKKYKSFGSYLNFLQAYNDGEIDWLIDPRTGFLLRKGYLPKIVFENGEIRDYEELCIVGTDDLEGNLLVRSAKSRELQLFWKKDDCLIFIKGSKKNYMGGKRKTIRRKIVRRKKTVKIYKTSKTYLG
jgi:hypothetical protein